MESLVGFAADGLLLVIAVVGAVLLLKSVPVVKMIAVYPYAIMAGLTSLLVGKLMSLLYQPEFARPFLQLGVAPGAAYIDNPGFPSDHALLATVIVLAVLALTKYRKTAYLLALLLLVMSVARVIALVHTPVDILGGILAGLLGGLWYLMRDKSYGKQ